MRKIENSFRVVAGLIALLIIAPQPSVGQENKQAAPSLGKKQASSAQILKRPDADKKFIALSCR